MHKLIDELKRRNVVRVAIAYAAVSWLILQCGDLVFDAFDLPHAVMRVVLVLLLLGFVPTLVFAWVYELTPEGLKRESEVPSGQSIRHLTGRKLDYIVIGVLAAIVAVLLAQRVLLPQRTISSGSAATVSGEAATSAPAHSIAVLPFANMSGDRGQDYFSDGLAEELLDQLARIPQLRVIGRSSSFSFRGSHEDLPSIGRKLGVATLLEGSVRRAGDRLRISTQLIDARNGYELWSQRYDRRFTDVFAVQDEIATAVVAALRVELLPGQHAAGAPHRTDNTEAYNDFLLARQFFNRGGTDNYARAVATYRHAIELDPGYAAAYAGLAFAETYAANLAGSAADVKAGQQRGLDAANRAIELDPQLADGYAARGFLRSSVLWDWNGAQADFARAIELDAADGTTQRRYGLLLAGLGRLDDAHAASQQATRSDPLSAAAWTSLCIRPLARGDLAQARAALEQALQVDPEYAYAHYWLGVTLLEAGDARAAQGHFDKSGDVLRQNGTAMAQFALGDRAAAQRALDALVAADAENSAYQIAQVYARWGRHDEAFRWLDRAFAQHDGGLSYLKWDPLVAGLRDDPRYAALLDKVGLPR